MFGSSTGSQWRKEGVLDVVMIIFSVVAECVPRQL